MGPEPSDLIWLILPHHELKCSQYSLLQLQPCATTSPKELKIRGPDTFKGKPNEDLNVWLQRVQLYFTSSHTADDQAIWIAMNLEGAAFIWFQNEDSYRKSLDPAFAWDLPTLTAAMKSYYIKPTKSFDSFKSLMDLRQTTSVRDFAQQFLL